MKSMLDKVLRSLLLGEKGIRLSRREAVMFKAALFVLVIVSLILAALVPWLLKEVGKLFIRIFGY